jgi:teichuronic acid biosynthesis protein TuaE
VFILELIIWIFGIIFKDFFEFMPFFFGRNILFYIFLVLTILYFRKSYLENLSINTVIKQNFTKHFLILFGFVLVFQLMAMIKSSFLDNSYEVNLIHEYISLLILIFYILVHVFGMKFIIIDVNSINKFLKASKIALIISLIVSYFQIFFLVFPNSFFLNHLFFWFGKLLEARWISETGEAVHRFYTNGSYVQTNRRTNGLTEEASMNAITLAVLFMPLLLASIKEKFNIFNNDFKINIIYFLFVANLIILLLGRTSIGIFFFIVSIGIYFFTLSNKRKILLFSGAIFGLLIIIFFNYEFIEQNIMVYINKVLDLQNGSTANRLGNTIALFKTSVENFYFGTGRGYLDYYILDNYPDWVKKDYEFSLFKNSFPVLSTLLGFTAEYGLFIFIGIAFLYGNKIALDRKKLKEIDGNKFVRTFLFTQKYFYIYFILGCLVNLYWYENIYLILLIFYLIAPSIIYRNLYIKEVS